MTPPVGSVLVSTYAIDGDEHFDRAAVALFERDDDGVTFGLVLNRPAGVPAAEVLEDADELLVDPDEECFYGGPVVGEHVVLAEFADRGGVETLAVRDGVPAEMRRPRPWLDDRIGIVLATLEDPARLRPHLKRTRLFLGLSCWAPGQLDEEVRRGIWRVAPSSPEALFCAEPEALHAELLAQTR
jgi:putative transcriptional regulator